MQARPENGPERPPGRPLRVVIVDDDRDAADTMRLLLDLWGHEAAVARSGPAGVQTVRELQADVVLCDLALPGMDGWAVARALRGEPATAGAHLVAVSGHGHAEDQKRCREAGFDLHLTKPVDPALLRRLLETLDARWPRGDQR